MPDSRPRQLEQLDVTVIITNRTRHGSPLWSEHGLSLLLDCHWTGRRSRRILFDTGASGDLLKHNLGTLQVSPGDLDAVFLSHGHLDHTGGLSSILDAHEAEFTVVAHPEITRAAVTTRNRLQRISPGRETWDRIPSSRLILLREPAQIFPGVWVSGSIPRTTPFEEPREGQFTLEDGCLVPDNDPDDMAMLFDLGSAGPVVITGCSHAGAVNTLLHARTVLGAGETPSLIGGLHLIGAGENRLESTVQGLHELNPAEIRPGHCTGEAAEGALEERFGDRHHPFSTGDRFSYHRHP